MRRAARTDRNQPEIVKALRQKGWSVHPLHMVGQGFPDICVGAENDKGRVCILMEIKDGLLPPSQRKLTDDELEFHSSWRGPIAVVKSVPEAIKAVEDLLKSGGMGQ